MKSKIHIQTPTATAADWRWREYKGYLAICGDCVICEVVGNKAFAAPGGLPAGFGKRALGIREAAA